MVRGKEDPVDFAWEGDMRQDAVREVVIQLWYRKPAGKEVHHVQWPMLRRDKSALGVY